MNPLIDSSYIVTKHLDSVEFNPVPPTKLLREAILKIANIAVLSGPEDRELHPGLYRAIDDAYKLL
jgi:hypothetical protein